MVEMLKALADENRLRLIYLLASDEFCVCEIELFLSMSQSNVSRHLSKLKSAGIIRSKKEAQWVFYSVSETFKLNFPGLFKDLMDNASLLELVKTDRARVNAYKEQGLNCQMVTSDKESVITKINVI